MTHRRAGRRVRRAERGAIALMGTVIIVLLIALAFLLAVPLAQGLSDKREASTAADSAALAAVDEWSDFLEETHGDLDDASPARFWAFPGSPVTEFVSPRMRAAAEELAAANGAELTDFSVSPSRLEVRVRVRMLDESIEGSGIHAEHRATAALELRGGLCVRGGRLGLEKAAGRGASSCITEVPPVPTPTPEPAPTPTASASPGAEPTPVATTPPPRPSLPPVFDLRAFRADTVLTE